MTTTTDTIRAMPFINTLLSLTNAHPSLLSGLSARGLTTIPCA